MFYQPTSFRLPSEIGGRIAAFRASGGYKLWEKNVAYRTRPLINDDTIIAHPAALDLLSGEAKAMNVPKSYGCGQISGSRNLLMFRSGTLGYYDFMCNVVGEFRRFDLSVTTAVLKRFVFGWLPGFCVQPLCVPLAGSQINRGHGFDVFAQQRRQIFGLARQRNMKIHGIRFTRFRKRVGREFRLDCAYNRVTGKHSRFVASRV